jgi:hypothetical protein
LFYLALFWLIFLVLIELGLLMVVGGIMDCFPAVYNKHPNKSKPLNHKKNVE